jgi:hypothetical protein
MLATEYEAGKQTYFHRLNGRKLFMVFKSAISEGLQLNSHNSNFSNDILNAKSSKAFCGLRVCFSAVMIGIY